MAIWSILQPFGAFLFNCYIFMVIWYIFPRFGMLHQETSGNPADDNDKGGHDEEEEASA
jgi:hypothetical protein